MATADFMLCGSSFSLFFVLFCNSLQGNLTIVNAGENVAPSKPAAVFIFGDSTVDVGTNNWLPSSQARADFSPNGIDLPYSVPTGRFSNGLNSADQIVRLFGYQRSPQPFLFNVNHSSTFKRDILQGVNFASAGAGILYETGKDFGNVVSMGEQVKQFATVRENITELIGSLATDSMFSKSLFVISVGSNDVFDLFKSFANATLLDQAAYFEDLELTYHNHLQELYELGARKFGIISVPPVGCCPGIRARSNDSSVCVEELNNLALTFFTQIQALLQKMSSELKGFKYSLGNAYEMTMHIIEEPLTFGFKDAQSACCGSGTLNAQSPCCIFFNPSLCSNRQEFLFWDFCHPTEYASKLAAVTLYGGGTRFVTPMNFSQLVATDV